MEKVNRFLEMIGKETRKRIVREFERVIDLRPDTIIIVVQLGEIHARKLLSLLDHIIFGIDPRAEQLKYFVGTKQVDRWTTRRFLYVCYYTSLVGEPFVTLIERLRTSLKELQDKDQIFGYNVYVGVNTFIWEEAT